MALGSLTHVAGSTSVWGNKRMRLYDVQLTSGANYTTGGETITPGMVGLNSIEQVNVTSNPRSAAGTAVSSIGADYSTLGQVKMLAYFSSSSGTADAQVAASTDLSTFTVRVQFIGT